MLLGAYQGNRTIDTAAQSAVGAVRGGPIVSTALGTYAALGGTGPLVRTWSGLARGAGFVAVCEEGEVWVQDSSTAGARLRQVPVVVAGQEVRQPWSRVAAAGNAIALVGRDDGAIYLSTDAGQTWSRTAAPSSAWNALALGDGGQVIVAGNAGGVRMSRDGGATFTPLPMPAGQAWQALAASADGNMLAAGSAQGLHTSLGNRTTYANAGGAIEGGPGDFVELEAVGMGVQFRVRSASGGPFTVR